MTDHFWLWLTDHDKELLDLCLSGIGYYGAIQEMGVRYLMEKYGL
jgi:hypothetical protein